MAKHPPDQPDTEGTPADKPAPDHLTGTAPEELAKTANPVPVALTSAALLADIAGLPPVPGTDGLRANAAYYASNPKELADVLRGLTFEDNEAATNKRDALLKRIEGGEFGSVK